MRPGRQKHRNLVQPAQAECSMQNNSPVDLTLVQTDAFLLVINVNVGSIMCWLRCCPNIPTHLFTNACSLQVTARHSLQTPLQYCSGPDEGSVDPCSAVVRDWLYLGVSCSDPATAAGLFTAAARSCSGGFLQEVMIRDILTMR